MLKQIVFIAGDVPGKRTLRNDEVSMVVDQLEPILTTDLKEETFFALHTDTEAPRSIIRKLARRVPLVGKAESSALNHYKYTTLGINEPLFLSFLQEHVGKATVLIICSPTATVERFVKACGRLTGVVPESACTLRYGTIHILEVATGKVQTLTS